MNIRVVFLFECHRPVKSIRQSGANNGGKKEEAKKVYVVFVKEKANVALPKDCYITKSVAFGLLSPPDIHPDIPFPAIQTELYSYLYAIEKTK